MISTDYVYYKRYLIYNKEPHKEHLVNKKVCLALLKRSNALLLRNTYHFDKPIPTSFWFLIKDRFTGMEELSRRTRNKVRHAIKFFDIAPISISMMMEQGYDVYIDSFVRYSHTTDDVLSRSSFIEALQENPIGREYWGVIDKRNGVLVAYSENYCKDDMCEYYMLKARSRYMSGGGYYPFYSLFYKMNEHYLLHRKMRYVSDGSRSITEHSLIQPFLTTKFKFRNAYTDIQVVYVPWLRLAVNILYPLRKMIPILKVRALLHLEEMNRGEV